MSAIRPIGVRLVGVALDGLVVGWLTALLLRQRGVVAPILTWTPILFSWFIRHAHTTTHRYVYRGGELISVGDPRTLHSELVIMLIVAGATGIAMANCLRGKAEGEQ